MPTGFIIMTWTKFDKFRLLGTKQVLTNCNFGLKYQDSLYSLSCSSIWDPVLGKRVLWPHMMAPPISNHGRLLSSNLCLHCLHQPKSNWLEPCSVVT